MTLVEILINSDMDLDQTVLAIKQLFRMAVPDISTGHKPQSGSEIGWDACREETLRNMEKL